MRCHAAYRLLSCTLLLLAVAAYCGLPSNPPGGFHDRNWAVPAEAAAQPAPDRYVVPAQAKEYRGREIQLAADDLPGADDVPMPAAPTQDARSWPRAHPVALVPAPTHRLVSRSRSARAPPAA